MRKLFVGTSVAFATLSLAACGTTVTERAATGALGGAAVGAAVSGDTKGALIGGAVGAGVGAATAPNRRRR